MKHKISQFLASDPSEIAIEKFFLVEVLPYDKRSMNEILEDKRRKMYQRNPVEVAYEQVFYAVDEQLANLIHKIVKPENNLWNMDNQALIDRFFDVRNQVVDLIVAINQCDLHTEEVEGKND